MHATLADASLYSRLTTARGDDELDSTTESAPLYWMHRTGGTRLEGAAEFFGALGRVTCNFRAVRCAFDPCGWRRARGEAKPFAKTAAPDRGERNTILANFHCRGAFSNQVAQIVQDDRGFMWFGTQYGLNRYDGYKFRVFVHDPRRPNSLGGTWIYSLFKDRSGMLWIGCDQSLDRLDPATEEFTHYRIESGDSEGSPGPVVHVSQDRTGMLWLATGTGPRRLDPRTGQIKKYRHDPGNPSGLSTNDVRWTGEDTTGILWVGTNSSLEAFDRESEKVTVHIPLDDEMRKRGMFGYGRQSSFYEDRFGVFWVFSGSGVAVFESEDQPANALFPLRRGASGGRPDRCNGHSGRP
jgi:hypothetical protein